MNATIGADDRAPPPSRRRPPPARASRCVKVKVGIGDDAGRVAAVRDAVGPDMALRIDANGAWDVEEASRRSALAPVGLELVEEPVHGIARAARGARARRGPRRDGRDRRQPGALRPAADAVCLKISRGGGSPPPGPGRARARGRRRRLPRLDLRRPAGDRRRRPLRRRAAATRRAASRRSSCSPTRSPCGPRGRRDRRARAARARRLAQRGDDRRGRLARQAVARARDDDELGVGERRRHPLGERAELRVAAPAITITGIVSSGRRSQSGSIAPVPIPRSAAGQPGGCCAGGPRADAAASGGCRRTAAARPALGELPRSSRLDPAARLVGGAAGGALRLVLDPGRRPDEHQAPTRSGAASATCSAIRPPIE